MRRIHVGVRTVVAFAAMTLAVSPVIALTAGASGPGPNTWTSIGEGVNPATIPNVTVFGTLPANTPEQVSFILQEQNKNQLEYQTEQGFNHFLTTSQFAQYFGQSQSNINSLRSYLGGFGISTTVYADNVDVSATGTAGEFDAALSVTQDNYRAPHDPDGSSHGSSFQNFHGPTTSPQLPYRLSQFVLAVFGLTNYSPFSSQAVSRVTGSTTGTITAKSTTDPATCLAETGDTNDCNLPQDFASNYGMTQLNRHANGSGQTVGIVTLAALDAGLSPNPFGPTNNLWAPQDFWQFAGINQTGSLNVQNIDGGPGVASVGTGSDETDLDVEQAGGVAPGANIILYQAPNTDGGYVDAFFQATSDNIAGSISSSWGESETYVSEAVASGQETSAYQAAFDEAFLEMAAQGQSGFVAAGDSAAYDTNSTNDYGPAATTNLSVDIPAASPYITTGGGTTLPNAGSLPAQVAGGVNSNYSVTQQRAWAWDYLWPAVAGIFDIPLSQAAQANVVGTGGGFSANEPEPSYQYGVSGTNSFNAVKYLTPTGYTNVNGIFAPTTWNFNPTPSVSHGYGSGRALPDLSADADPQSGYIAYVPSYLALGDSPLEIFGGTSFVGPQLNGVTAVIDSYVGHRVGFWNPSIYQFAQSWNSPFTPLQQAGTGNDNIYYTGNPGALFNEATGLGTPNISALARDFAN
jgi:subtilase family serine protease